MNHSPEEKPIFSIGLTIYIILSYIVWFIFLNSDRSMGAAIFAYAVTPFIICANAAIVNIVLAVSHTKYSKMPTNILNLVVGGITYMILMGVFN